MRANANLHKQKGGVMNQPFTKPFGFMNCSALVKLNLRQLARLGSNGQAVLDWEEHQPAIQRLPDSTLRILVAEGVLREESFLGKRIHMITPRGMKLVEAMDEERKRHPVHHHAPWRPVTPHVKT